MKVHELLLNHYFISAIKNIPVTSTTIVLVKELLRMLVIKIAWSAQILM